MMRLLITADAVGGVGTYALDLARGLVAHGVETVLAVLGPAPDDGFEARARAVPDLELVATDLPLDWTAQSPAALETVGGSVARLVDKHRVDIAHLNSAALAAAGRYQVPVIVGCHSCVATWWQAVKHGPPPPDFVWRIELVRRGYQAADALVAPTAAFAEASAGAYGLRRQPNVVHNGRDTGRSMPDHDLGDFVFTAGRLWDEGKNLAALDRAAQRLPLPILAAGPLEGPNGAGIDLGYLWTLGHLDEAEIRRFLSAQPIFVSTALYEPFGLAVLEAAQAGCALVLSDIPSFRELWDGAAEFVPPANDAAIAAAIDAVYRDADRRKRLGAAAMSRARGYSVARMAEAMMTIYRAALSTRDAWHLEAAE